MHKDVWLGYDCWCYLSNLYVFVLQCVSEFLHFWTSLKDVLKKRSQALTERSKTTFQETKRFRFCFGNNITDWMDWLDMKQEMLIIPLL